MSLGMTLWNWMNTVLQASYDIVRKLIEQKEGKAKPYVDELKYGSTLDEAFFRIYGEDLNEYIDSGAWKR
jgi:hypothetical protein